MREKAAVYSGLDIAGSTFFGYGGFIVSPWSRILEDGLLIKIGGGGGQYQYNGLWNEGGSSYPVEYTGQASIADALLGYRFSSDNLIIKTFVGLNYTHHEVAPFDAGNAVQGGKIGAKAEIDIWSNLNSMGWFSLHGQYSTAFSDYWSQGRLAVNLLPRLSLGVEGALYGSQNYDAHRIGGLIRIDTDFGDFTISGGYGGNREEEMTPYIGLSLYQRF